VECKRPANIRKNKDSKSLGPITISLLGFKPRQNCLDFCGETKSIKEKRSGPYQDQDRGGIRITDAMFKALKLAWIDKIG